MWVYKWSKRNNYGKQGQLRIHPEEGVNVTGLPVPKTSLPFCKLLGCFSTLL